MGTSWRRATALWLLQHGQAGAIRRLVRRKQVLFPKVSHRLHPWMTTCKLAHARRRQSTLCLRTDHVETWRPGTHARFHITSARRTRPRHSSATGIRPKGAFPGHAHQQFNLGLIVFNLGLIVLKSGVKLNLGLTVLSRSRGRGCPSSGQRLLLLVLLLRGRGRREHDR